MRAIPSQTIGIAQPASLPEKAPVMEDRLQSIARFRTALLVTLIGLSVVACSSPAATSPGAASPQPTPSISPSADASPTAVSGRLVVYSGRSEELVGPILAEFETQTGVDLEVRYGDTAELAATILEEGDASPADLFFGQDAGALGALAAEERLAELPGDLLERVDPRFRSPDGLWVGVTGRARVAAYDTRELSADDLPDSVLDLTDTEWKGRIGWVPTNGSFQAFVTGLRRIAGEEGAREWLEGMQANEPKVYEGNAAALEAVRAGEIDLALINHYYLFQAQAEAGQDYPVANHFFRSGDPGALVNVAGAGLLESADNPDAARALVDFLLAERAQTYFATETFEYPLAAGVEPDPELPPLAEIESPDMDLSDLADLEGTLRLLQEVGVI
jgi:iron(III) transport system substrate-binding protein